MQTDKEDEEEEEKKKKGDHGSRSSFLNPHRIKLRSFNDWIELRSWKLIRINNEILFSYTSLVSIIRPTDRPYTYPPACSSAIHFYLNYFISCRKFYSFFLSLPVKTYSISFIDSILLQHLNCVQLKPMQENKMVDER